MPAARTADDKLLALLARMPAPMETSDILEALHWSRQNLMLVVKRLVDDGLVVRMRGECTGDMGRPQTAYALRGAPTDNDVRQPLTNNTVVVTPTDQEARVVRMLSRWFAEIEYITGPEKSQRSTLHIKMLRAFQPGRERPEPVRIVAKAAA